MNNSNSTRYMADVGSILGGWLSSFFLKLGWSLNRSRKITMLICALCAIPIMFASKASSVWGTVALLSLATAAHQGWPANLFTTVSDIFPRKAVASVVGMGGKFTFFPLLGEDQKGSMTVMDIPKGGLKFQMESTALFQKGDILEVEFILDNKNKTLIRKQVYVRNIKDNFVNIQFCAFDTNEPGDKALGFYLY